MAHNTPFNMRVMQESVTLSPNSDCCKIADKVTTFVQALRDKYIEQEEFDDQFKLPKDRSISTEITFVGFKSVTIIQRQLRQLVSIDLSSRSIKYAGDLTALGKSLGKVSILNLADNFLTWHEIIKILDYLPNLREIILTGNQLHVEDGIIFPPEPHKKLISITLGRIRQDWTKIMHTLSRIWMAIEQVDLWDSQLSSENLVLHGDSSFVHKIKCLGLSQNSFPDLNWINQAGDLSSLDELDMSRCHLKSFLVCQAAVNQLSSLRLLNISHNDISEWSSITSLNKLKRLRHLICHDNPIFIAEKSANALTVARISALTQLNREDITPSYRRDSEILYLRETFKTVQAKNVDVDRDHPRYKELIETYGVPEDLHARQAFEKYITVDLCFGSQSIKKKLPCDMRLSNLQMLCKRLFNLKPSVNMEIVCCESSHPDAVSYPLDKDGQTLHFFSVRTGYILIIKEIA